MIVNLLLNHLHAFPLAKLFLRRRCQAYGAPALNALLQ